jgi:integrase
MIIPLTKNKVAVLSPYQWHLIEKKLNADYKIRGDFLLHTAMRISEAYYVARHPECFREDHGAIFLPKVEGKEKFGKKRAKQKERSVLLSPKGVAAVKLFFEKDVGLPSYQAMEPVFKLAAKEADFDTHYIMTKMLRKTYISWLINSYRERQSMIALSSGHSRETMDRFYITFGFRKEDVNEMKLEVADWGDA